MLSLGTVHTSNDKISMSALTLNGGATSFQLTFTQAVLNHCTLPSVRADRSARLGNANLLRVCSVIMVVKSDIDTSSMTSSHPLGVVPRYLAASRSNTANKATANSDHSAARSSLELFLAGKLQVSAL